MKTKLFNQELYQIVQTSSDSDTPAPQKMKFVRKINFDNKSIRNILTLFIGVTICGLYIMYSVNARGK